MVEEDIKSIVPPDIVEKPQYPILTQATLSEGNLGNITSTILIDISEKPSVMEHNHLGQTSSSTKIITYMALFKEFHDVFA